MDHYYELYRNWMAVICLFAILAIPLAYGVAIMLGHVGRALKRGRSAVAKFLFAVLFALPAFYMGATKIDSKISYPATDVTATYIIDAGSYVTNDAVNVQFTFVVAPPEADFILEACPLSATNDEQRAEQSVTVIESTLGEYGDGEPHFVLYLAATNYNWVGYTTWSPGSSVTTNGVWHLPGWGANGGKSLVPRRTSIYEDDGKLAPSFN